MCAVALLTTALPAAGASTAPPSATAVEIRLHDLVAAERRAAGLGPLRTDVRLVAAARAWSGRMADERRLSHHPDVASVSPPGVVHWAENIGRAGGSDPAGQLFDAFMASTAHRASILSERMTELGIGVAHGGGDAYATMRLAAGAPASVHPAVVATANLARGLFTDLRASHAVVVRDDAFPDALTAGPLAGADGPVLFTPPGPALHPAVRLALERILPEGATVWVIGGALAVSRAAEDELRAAGWDVRRVAGRNRIETAAAVAGAVARERGRPDTVLLATVADWPDAASGGAFGARAAAPVLLATADELPRLTAEALAELRPGEVIALGGRAVLSDRVLDAAGARRLSGVNRQDTAAAVAEGLWGRVDADSAGGWAVVPADGDDNWAWALGIAPLGARLDEAVLLASPPLSDGLSRYLDELGFGRGEADLRVHGPVEPAAVEQVEDLLG